MVRTEYTDRVCDFQKRLGELISTKPLTARDILIKQPSRFGVEGVYAISKPDDSEIVYVGMTRIKSVTERLRDHLIVDTKSDLKGMLKYLPSYPQEASSYLVRCIEIADLKERKFFEHFAISILQPPFNK